MSINQPAMTQPVPAVAAPNVAGIRVPVSVTCPGCKQTAMSKVQCAPSKKQLIIFVIMFCIGCFFGVCWIWSAIPFCIPKCYAVAHQCPKKGCDHKYGTD